jgi:methionyl-tRNA formyltransferase
MRILFAGTPDFSVPPLQALLDEKHDVCAVYSQPDRPAGRGRKLQASPVKQLAMAHDIPVYQPLSLRKVEAQTELAALEADLMIVIAYGLILPQAVLDMPRKGCINVHASLLPRWRGAAPIQRAILAGDSHSGITIMQMEAGLDTGPMLLKQTCPITVDDTGQSLHDKLSQQGADALIQALRQFDDLQAESQDDTQSNYAKKLSKAESQIDWQKSAVVLDRQIRAFNPWPSSQAVIEDVTLKVWQAEVLNEKSIAPAGTLLRGSKLGLDVATGDGVLRITTVQSAGKRRMSVVDFLNAHPEFKR